MLLARERCGWPKGGNGKATLRCRRRKESMDSNRIDALIKQIKERRAFYYDITFAAEPGTTDPEIFDRAQRAAEFVAEYDSLLAIIEG